MLEKDFLEEHYLKLNKSISQIGREFNISSSEISYWLKKYSLKIRPRGASWNTIDITGKRFGSLLVVKQLKGTKYCSIWECLCDCGNIRKATSRGLRCGQTIACKLCRPKYNWTGYGEMSGEYFSNIKYRAKLKNIEFNITKEYLWNLFLQQNRLCPLTGNLLYFKINNKEQTASLDRIDSNKGYIIDNVQWIDKNINYVKSDFSKEEFIILCNQVAKMHPRDTLLI